MKLFKIIPLIVLGVLLAYFLTGCGKKQDEVKKDEQKKEQNHEDHSHDNMMIADGKYFCPMHPTQQSDNADARCPICKMKLDSKAEHNKKMSEEHEAMETKYAGKKDLIHFEIMLSPVKSDECEKLLEAALSKDPGVVEYHIDIVNKMIHLYIDKGKTTKKNVEKLVSDAGFDANDTKANPEGVSKLPADCK